MNTVIIERLFPRSLLTESALALNNWDQVVQFLSTF